MSKYDDGSLREQERFIHQIAELTPVVLTVFDLVTQHDIYISSDVINMHGYTPDELTWMKDLFTDLLHPEDALRVRDHFARLKQAEDGEVREIEYRIRHRNGEWRWLRSRQKPFARNDQGVVQQVVTATLDITERKQAEEALRERDERFRSYFELGLIGMAITSPTKGIIEVNDEICRSLGYERSELLQMTWAELTHPDDVAADVANFNRVMAGEIDGYVMDKRWIHKDGQVIDATISVKCLRRADGTVDYFIALSQDITTRKQAEAALQRAHNELERRVIERTEQLTAVNAELVKEITERERAEEALQDEIEERRGIEEERLHLLRRTVMAQEGERGRIAREMHDQFGQQLSALTLKLAMLKEGCGEQTELCEQIEQLQAIAKQLDGDVDFLVWELRPTALDDLGLLAALTNYVKGWSKHFIISAELHTSGMEKDRLTSEIETVLYRIMQEALTNIAKHAGAEHVDILLERRNDHISLIVEDDGVGFEAEQPFGAGDKGLGLIGMRERAALVGGTLEIESSMGNGATVVVRIPVPNIPNGAEAL
jgi:PAS domain S-box-containing protein